jgi:methyl-accepting chemotaxis protein
MIPPPFQVRLDIYAIDEECLAARKDVWALLEPKFAAIFEAYRQQVISAVPAYAERMRKLPPEYALEFKKHVRKLFCEPYDENWVRAAYDRMKLEIGSGQDMRSRATQCRGLISGFTKLVGRHHRFSGPAAARLIECAMRVFLLDMANAVAVHNESHASSIKARQHELEQAIGEFETSVGSVRNTVSSAVSSLNQTSGELADLAKDAATQTRTAIASAGAAADEVTSTASATDELSFNCAQMFDHATRGAQIARKAVEDTGRTNSSVAALAEAVQTIGSVVGLISNIAAQTNLLALNATIEAARAGEAGRGFSVVASEVKSLANQTSKATEEIAKHIAAIQDETRRATDDISSIGSTVTSVASLAETVAQAIEEQRTATASIAESVGRAREHTSVVANAIRSVGDAIQKAEGSAAVVLSQSGELARRTADLDSAVGTLLSSATAQAAAQDFADLSKADELKDRPVYVPRSGSRA